ncbi:hypothetical protein PHJA_000609000 [Phtheirospermum japonicum]|uniref:Uncharacterized protein n=1 Tax=Phtheirospermum japonicum TaxID=374723 RepID=A0A830BRL3_9LAMI|nr:hypothetical protein PHJA_000609000 [Phtheirospermum japonicum]
MSFPGRKRPFYPSSPGLLLLIISLVHVWISSQNQAGAIRVFPAQRLLSAAQASQYSMEPPPPPPMRNQAEISADYFNGRDSSDLNSTTTTANGTFLDYKRRIPSCPDPLHN